MKPILYSLLLLFYLAVSRPMLAAQTKTDVSKVKPVYDVDYEMNFDNREFYRSRFSKSMTIFGARLTPSVGVSVIQKNRTSHSVMLGIDIMKDFGASDIPGHIASEGSSETDPSLRNKALFREITMYYGLRVPMKKTSLSLYAGIFPRNFMDGRYSTAFFSDSLKFYDNNLEGILLKIKRPKAQYELGCDWMGMFGLDRRERFMIFSSGEARVQQWMTLGYSAYMYHFSCSANADGVVDNMLLNPYVRFSLGKSSLLDSFDVTLAYLQSLQNDRLNVGRYVFPRGGELSVELSRWNVYLRNSLFYGTDMMPYYNSHDVAGVKYGNILYPGDPFYRVHDDGSGKPGIYDCLDISYEPRIGKRISIRVAALFHFNDGYSGCQQIVGLKFDLNKAE